MPSNDLIHETSPYLLQHAHNPVHWHAWTAENLNEAQQRNQILLVSIGYSSCHWCHVMEKESFEDEEVAAYMNENFYCIKVDREERPDVDQPYMTAANIITKRGGWPLNCFALPNGKPFHAGTYYPKRDWLRLLENVVSQYETQKAKLEDYAERLTRGIRMQETAISDSRSQPLDLNAVISATESWLGQWDNQRGGINRAPKFPMPSNLSFLLHFSTVTNSSLPHDLAHLTLQKMAKGGIYDQLGGGFARYSVDMDWKVVHFEKMLYDNGQLLSVYAKAYRSTSDILYRTTLENTIAWLEHEMRDESGLFYSALDADSEGEEGKFYTWTTQELQQHLGDLFPVAQAYFGIDREATWENTNILMQVRDRSQVSSDLGIPSDEVDRALHQIHRILTDLRSKRERPGLDNKCLASWNGLTITGLCNAYKALGNENHLGLAVECFKAIEKHMVVDGCLYHTYTSGKTSIDALLEDHCFVAEAALSLFEVTGDPAYADKAKDWVDQAVDLFYDADKEIFYFNQENELVLRTSEIYDNVIPSSNAVMDHLLQRIGMLYGLPHYLNLSEHQIGKVQQNMSEHMGGHSHWAEAHLMYSAPYFEVVITGPEARNTAHEMWHRAPLNTWIVFAVQENNLPLFEHRWNTNTPIYVCERGICQLPVDTIKDAIQRITE